MTTDRIRKQNKIMEVIHWLTIGLVLIYVFIFNPANINKETIIIAACVAALYVLVVHRWFPRLMPLSLKLKIGTYLDVLLITFVLSVTGFALSPFFFLYFLSLLFELIVQGPEAIYPQTFYITAAYLIMCYFQPKALWAQPNIVAIILVNMSALWIISYFTRNLKAIKLAAEEKKK